MLKCAGCDTISLVRTYWYSEDCDPDGDPITHTDRYPPAPTDRRIPDWSFELILGMTVDGGWVNFLMQEVYSALGMKAHRLAAMGIRTIVDHIVTSNAGEGGTFKSKIERMREMGKISDMEVDVIYSVFDLGSATAHRGHMPSKADLNTMLDVAEGLLERLYVDPIRRERQIRAAQELKARIPKRPSRT